MEFQEPELQETYDKCKYTVKVWEYKFQKKYKRVPSKLDIKEANRDVRNAYKRYFQLKTSILEQSFRGIEGFDDIEEEDVKNEANEISVLAKEHSDNCTKESDCPEVPDVSETNSNFEDVWGQHLNYQKDEVSLEEKAPVSKLNLNITKKLFCGSKFSKRNPRKSLTQKNKNDTDQQSLSQPTPSFSSFSSEEAINSLQNDILDKRFPTVSHFQGSLSEPMKLVQTFLDSSQQRPLKSVDAGWLKRVSLITGTSQDNPDLLLAKNIEENAECESTKLDYDSEDIIENSDEEDSFKNNVSLHIAKKRKTGNVTDLNEKLRNGDLGETPSDLGLDNELRNRDSQRTPSDRGLDSEISLKKIDEKIKEYSAKNISGLSEEKDKFGNDAELHLQKLEENSLQEKEADFSIKSNYRKNGSPITRKSSRKNVYKTPSKNKEGDHIKNKVPDESSKRRTTRQTPKKEKNKLKADVNAKTPKNKTQTSLPVSQRRSSRKTKVKVSLQEFPSEEEDAFHTDTDEKDPEFSLEDKPTAQTSYELNSEEESIPEKRPRVPKIKSNVVGSTKKTRKNKTDEQSETETDTYDLEFSIKPRIVAPRYGSIKDALPAKKIRRAINKAAPSDDNPTEKTVTIKNKRQQAKEKLQQKMASGSLNDNFVRIDIKKKVFVRGKSKTNFSKYKKNQWKKAKALAGPDMYMGGCDGGKLTCFNCGQEGHFAQHCKATEGDGLLALNAEEEEDCPFPTLEEASKMALEQNLSVRRPKIALKEIQNSENNDNIDELDNGDPFDDFDSDELVLEALKLEEHVKKLDVQMYMDNVKVVEPYYDLKPDNTIIDTPTEVYEVLKKFGHSSFRPGQEQAIMRILSGKSTLVTLSTGSGKSLCYQLPAYMFSRREPCISLIISPLVSLMDDQIMGIAKFMKAACLHSNQTAVQRKKILEAISLGDLSILLVSPEAVVAGEKQRGFGSFLRKLPPIAFACIDEAHCVSQWSHNFRPSYLMICRVLRESLGVKTILGLTATATKATQTSIIRHLKIPDGEDGVITDIPLPDNLKLSVSKDVNRDFALLSLLLSERYKDSNSVIVYCTRRQECERIAGFLRTSLKSEQPVQETNKKRKRVNLQAEPYHAGLSASRRRTIQNAFMSGELKIVVATVAFGMGINKSDIRAVIHYNMPNSFESYVQEVGRAGRDGLRALCHVFLDSRGGDENELRRHIHSNSIDRHVIRKLLEKIFIPCSCKGVCPKHEVAFSIESTVRALDIPEENISTLLCYLELHENRYIELLSPAYTRCKVISYKGPLQIRKVAKECPPLAMAFALHQNKEGSDANVLEFPVIDVAAAMGWESGICKHKLKNLEWTSENGQPKRSTINVNFSDLGFRLLAPGNLSDEELDEALDNLYKRVVDQEKTALLQLNAIHQSLVQVAKPTYKSCLTDENDSVIKSKVREYFNSPDPLKIVPDIEYPEYNEDQLLADIQAIISMYRDNSFTGRAIARIFQGIQSPNYPATIWGRCKFWRSHLGEDFHVIVRTAAKEIVRMR